MTTALANGLPSIVTVPRTLPRSGISPRPQPMLPNAVADKSRVNPNLHDDTIVHLTFC